MRGQRVKPRVVPVKQPADGKHWVFLAVPSITGQVNWSIAHQFGRAMFNTAVQGTPIEFITSVVAGITPIQFARNKIVQEFIKSPCNWLMMVDDDQVMPDNFHELLSVQDADVVSGLTYCWVGSNYLPGRLRYNQYDLVKRPQVEYPECYNITPTEQIRSGQPYLVSIVGTGCIAIRRHVIEALGPEPFSFTYRKNGSVMAGEDINFSRDVQRAGFRIAVHPGVRFGHMKHLDLAQIEEYAAARREFENAGKQHTPEDMLSIGLVA